MSLPVMSSDMSVYCVSCDICLMVWSQWCHSPQRASHLVHHPLTVTLSFTVSLFMLPSRVRADAIVSNYHISRVDRHIQLTPSERSSMVPCMSAV